MFEESCPVTWHDVEKFFAEHGCNCVGESAMRWYEESWGVQMRADLEESGAVGDGDDDSDDDNRGILMKLRGICLVKMYLGFCDRLDVGEDETCLPDMLQTLNISPLVLAGLIGHEKLDNTHVDEIASIIEKETVEMIEAETPGVYQALLDHYGGASLSWHAIQVEFSDAIL